MVINMVKNILFTTLGFIMSKVQSVNKEHMFIINMSLTCILSKHT